MQVTPRQLVVFVDRKGREPFNDFMRSLGGIFRQRIRERLFRLESGNPGDCKKLAGGISELRCHFGAGYRIYYAEVDDTIVVLLVGGDKKTQAKDIQKAQQYWVEYKERNYD